MQYYNGKARIHTYLDIYRDEDDKPLKNADGSSMELKSYYIDERGVESSIKFNPLTLNAIESTDANGKKTKYSYYAMLNGATTYTDITNLVDDEKDGGTDDTYKKQSVNVKTKKVVVDRVGHTTTQEIDSLGNTYSMTGTANESTAVTTTSTYMSNSSSGYDSYLDYFFLNAVKTATNEAGKVITYEYDTDKARIKSITDQMGNKTEYQYYSGTTTAAEKMGLIKKELEHRKNSSGTLISNFNTTAYEYDTNGNRSKVIDNQSNATIEVRDKANRLTSVTDARGNVTTNTYDKLDRVISTKDAKNQETKTYYDDINLVTKVVDREGKETTYTYDRKNQLKKVQYADETEKSYKYDAVGNKISETDAAGRITYYVYDKMNNMIATILPMQDDKGNNTYILKNEYDAEGRDKNHRI